MKFLSTRALLTYIALARTRAAEVDPVRNPSTGQNSMATFMSVMYFPLGMIYCFFSERDYFDCVLNSSTIIPEESGMCNDHCRKYAKETAALKQLNKIKGCNETAGTKVTTVAPSGAKNTGDTHKPAASDKLQTKAWSCSFNGDRLKKNTKMQVIAFLPYTPEYNEKNKYLDGKYYDINTKRRFDDTHGIGKGKFMTTILGEAKIRMKRNIPLAAETIAKFLNKLLANPQIIPPQIWASVGWGTIKMESKDGWLYVGGDMQNGNIPIDNKSLKEAFTLLALEGTQKGEVNFASTSTFKDIFDEKDKMIDELNRGVEMGIRVEHAKQLTNIERVAKEKSTQQILYGLRNVIPVQGVNFVDLLIAFKVKGVVDFSVDDLKLLTIDQRILPFDLMNISYPDMIYTLINLPEPGIGGYQDLNKHAEELKKYANQELVDLLFVAIVDICNNLATDSEVTVDMTVGGWAYMHGNASSKGIDHMCRKVLSGAFAAMERAKMAPMIAGTLDMIVQ